MALQQRYTSPGWRRIILGLGATAAVLIVDPAAASDTPYLQLERVHSLAGMGVGLDVATGSAGTIYLSSASAPGLWRLDRENGQFLPFVVYGQPSGSLERQPVRLFPEAIETDGQGRLWIADATLHQIVVVADTGGIIKTFGFPDLSLDAPVALSRLENNEMVAWDSKAGMLWRFSADLEPIEANRLNPGPQCAALQAEQSVCVSVGESELVVHAGDRIAARHTLESEARIGDIVSGPDKNLYLTDVPGKRLLSLSPELQPRQRFYLYESLFLRPTRFAFENDHLWLIDEGREELLQFTLRTAATGLEHALLGEEYLSLGYFTPALNELDSALGLGYRDDTVYLAQGRTLYGLQRYSEALETFDGVTGSQRDFWRGNTLFRLGEPEAALVAFQSALQDEPDNSLFRFNLAQTLLELERYAEAESMYRQLIDTEPDHVQARLGLARSLLGKGDHESAIGILDRLTGDDRIGREARHYLGLAYLVGGMPEAALPWLERAAREGPYFREALDVLAETNRNLGRVAQALRYEEQARTFDRRAEQLGALLLEETL